MQPARRAGALKDRPGQPPAPAPPLFADRPRPKPCCCAPLCLHLLHLLPHGAVHTIPLAVHPPLAVVVAAFAASALDLALDDADVRTHHSLDLVVLAEELSELDILGGDQVDHLTRLRVDDLELAFRGGRVHTHNLSPASTLSAHSRHSVFQ